jgi:hypothetical protein
MLVDSHVNALRAVLPSTFQCRSVGCQSAPRTPASPDAGELTHVQTVARVGVLRSYSAPSVDSLVSLSQYDLPKEESFYNVSCVAVLLSAHRLQRQNMRLVHLDKCAVELAAAHNVSVVIDAEALGALFELGVLRTERLHSFDIVTSNDRECLPRYFPVCAEEARVYVSAPLPLARLPARRKCSWLHALAMRASSVPCADVLIFDTASSPSVRGLHQTACANNANLSYDLWSLGNERLLVRSSVDAITPLSSPHVSGCGDCV